MDLWQKGRIYVFDKPEIIGNCYNATLKKNSLPDTITIRIKRDYGFFFTDIIVSLNAS